MPNGLVRRVMRRDYKDNTCLFAKPLLCRVNFKWVNLTRCVMCFNTRFDSREIAIAFLNLPIIVELNTQGYG